MTSKAATYDAIRRSTPTRHITRSRLRTNTDPSLPELKPQPELTHKIIVVGGAKCGKTSLARFYAEHPTKQTYSQTIGSDLYVVPYGVLCGRQVYLKIVDVGHSEVRGSPSFLSLTTADVSGVLLMFDVTNPESLTELDAWAATLRSYIPSLGIRVPVMVLAHKADCLQNRTQQIQYIQSTDLDRFVAANQFTGWQWTSTREINNNSSSSSNSSTNNTATSTISSGNHSKLSRSVPNAIHSLVEAILVSASEFYSKTRQSFSNNMQSNGSGTLAQLLRTHQSATYVQIPQTARPGESKLEAGAALLLPIEKKNIVGLPNVVVSTNGRNRKSNTLKKEMELVLYDRVRLQLKSLMEELERMNVCGSEKIRERIYCLTVMCDEEEEEMKVLKEVDELDGVRRWQMLLREVEELI